MDTEQTLPPQCCLHCGGKALQIWPIINNDSDNANVPPLHHRPHRLNRVDKWNFIITLVLGLASGILILYTLV